jgi:hypothetical protein
MCAYWQLCGEAVMTQSAAVSAYRMDFLHWNYSYKNIMNWIVCFKRNFSLRTLLCWMKHYFVWPVWIACLYVLQFMKLTEWTVTSVCFCVFKCVDSVCTETKFMVYVYGLTSGVTELFQLVYLIPYTEPHERRHFVLTVFQYRVLTTNSCW